MMLHWSFLYKALTRLLEITFLPLFPEILKDMLGNYKDELSFQKTPSVLNRATDLYQNHWTFLDIERWIYCQS